MQETPNSCFRSKKRSMTLHQALKSKHECWNVTATYVPVTFRVSCISWCYFSKCYKINKYIVQNIPENADIIKYQRSFSISSTILNVCIVEFSITAVFHCIMQLKNIATDRNFIFFLVLYRTEITAMLD